MWYIVYFCPYQIRQASIKNIPGRSDHTAGISKIYLEDRLFLQVYFCPYQIRRVSIKNIPGGSPHPAGIFLPISDTPGEPQKYTWRIA
jgi:hypothetical protein